MNEQLKLDVEIPCDYNVFIGHKKYQCASKKEAWDRIGQSTFGSLYEVRDRNGFTRPEFIPY